VKCYECEGAARLVIVEVMDESWAPTSWCDRPAIYAVDEVVQDPVDEGDSPREFCLGFNFQAMKEQSAWWALVEGVPTSVP